MPTCGGLWGRIGVPLFMSMGHSDMLPNVITINSFDVLQ
jgi:hypothetical protein